jgi:OOP family OmpA-OmpF porin
MDCRERSVYPTTFLTEHEEVRSMPSHRYLPHVVTASLLVALVGCGGSTQFSGGQAFAIAGTPPPPPPPPPPKKEEPPKPPPRVELRDNKIEFKEKIQFEVNKSVIKPESFGLLKEIADVMRNNPQAKKFEIAGHASSEGGAALNLALSDARAKAVMKHMVDVEKIDAARMAAKGYGITKPIGDNATEEGREKNRRVEFVVTEQDVTQKKVEIDPTTGKEKVLEEKKDTVKTDTGPGPADTTATKKPPTPPPADTTKKTPPKPPTPPPAPPGGKK